jgi:hypothetical protein
MVSNKEVVPTPIIKIRREEGTERERPKMIRPIRKPLLISRATKRTRRNRVRSSLFLNARNGVTNMLRNLRHITHGRSLT